LAWSEVSTNGAGVAQFLSYSYSPSDLTDYQQANSIDTDDVAFLMGSNNPNAPSYEGNLDIQVLTGVSQGIQSWFFITPSSQSQQPFAWWAANVSRMTKVPWQISVSWEYMGEHYVDLPYMLKFDMEIQKLAIRGVSILFASGDDGVGCNGPRQNPNWPATSPWVTVVGGFIWNGGSSYTGDSISSGGMSNVYPSPAFQVPAVQAYLKSGVQLPPKKWWNQTGRAYPDVAAFSENVEIYYQGNKMTVGGTSCAAPTWNGIIALINDAIIMNGGKPLGFLNPALYKIATKTPTAFIDITNGQNTYGGCQGFNGFKGWDPVTGWGGPNFPVLRDALRQLQADKKKLM